MRTPGTWRRAPQHQLVNLTTPVSVLGVIRTLLIVPRLLLLVLAFLRSGPLFVFLCSRGLLMTLSRGLLMTLSCGLFTMLSRLPLLGACVLLVCTMFLCIAGLGAAGVTQAQGAVVV